MTEPTVCAVLLTKDRTEMAARAVRSFRAQTYSNKRLLIFDTGNDKAGYFLDDDGIAHQWTDLSLQAWTIGRLRNEAIARAGECDIICHFDDDDVSHPNRLSEQVALLQASGADCVGYNEMLFWDTRKQVVNFPLVDITYGGGFGGEADTHRRYASGYPEYSGGEAWLYRNPSRCYALGTSLCYWRKAWERFPFDNAPRPDKLSFDGSMLSEYRTFLNGVKLEVERSVCTEPRMIASLHGGNTSSKITSGAEWRRAPEWDSYFERTMKLCGV
jgi:glycosyltransferase involved in cell wall biosynthesis